MNVRDARVVLNSCAVYRRIRFQGARNFYRWLLGQLALPPPLFALRIRKGESVKSGRILRARLIFLRFVARFLGLRSRPACELSSATHIRESPRLPSPNCPPLFRVGVLPVGKLAFSLPCELRGPGAAFRCACWAARRMSIPLVERRRNPADAVVDIRRKRPGGLSRRNGKYLLPWGAAKRNRHTRLVVAGGLEARDWVPPNLA